MIVQCECAPFSKMKENVYRGAHALTGLMFAPSEKMF